MEVIYQSKDFSRTFKNPVLTIGNFDGVHVGHQRIFQLLRDKALEIGGESVVYTFEPHPVEVLAPKRKPPIITPLPEKLRLIEDQGIDVVICATFSWEFASQTPEEFVRKVLYDQIQIRQLFVGHDFTFGKGGGGDISLLKQFGRKWGFNVEVIEAVRVEGKVVSSSLIREVILKGEMAEAAKLLGRHYLLSGQVIHGTGRGSRQIGFPTANLNVAAELFPKPGIYAVWALHQGRRYPAVANLGWKPTFQDQQFSVEVHILHFDQAIYGQSLQVEFVERLRDEVTFRNAEELGIQIRRDIEQAQMILQMP